MPKLLSAVFMLTIKREKRSVEYQEDILTGNWSWLYLQTDAIIIKSASKCISVSMQQFIALRSIFILW